MNNEPFITIFESKPIQGIVLKLTTFNPNYDFNINKKNIINEIQIGEKIEVTETDVRTDWGVFELR